MKFQAAAMSRANIPEDDRVDFSLYVDEFQNFSTESFATIMSEARKYHLNLIVANQFTTQLTEEIRDAVFGNMGSIVSFRVGQNDVEALAHYFQPYFEQEDILRVPNHNAIVRTLVNGVPTQPFSMSTLPPLGSPNPKLADALKQLSAAKYGQPKAKVEAVIVDRLATKIEPPSSNLVGQGNQQRLPGNSPASYGQMPPRSGQSSSFLDDWLSKRSSGGPTSSIPSSSPPSREPLVNNTPVPQALDSQQKTNSEQGVQQTANEVPLKSNTAPDEDTIYIDRQGNLHQP